MMNGTVRTILPAIAIAAIVASSPASAATTINVSLTGESGGKMGMDLSQSSVPAGKVKFDVTNAASSTGHEMVVVRLASKDEKLPFDARKDRVEENKVKSLGEVSGLKAGQHGTVTLDMTPGDYELICNHKGHYAAGMRATLTVTP